MPKSQEIAQGSCRTTYHNAEFVCYLETFNAGVYKRQLQFRVVEIVGEKQRTIISLRRRIVLAFLPAAIQHNLRSVSSTRCSELREATPSHLFDFK
ncbi:hypothetical protein V6N13_093242 [Hibiscus sabdariffa]